MKLSDIERYRKQAYDILMEANIQVTDYNNIEITDFGRNEFERLGLALYIRINEEEYASKWLVTLPGQWCPNHYHKIIKETFICMDGDVTVWKNDTAVTLHPGEMITLLPLTWHKFTSEKGCIIEEITTKQHPDDSYFEDSSIERYVKVE